MLECQPGRPGTAAREMTGIGLHVRFLPGVKVRLTRKGVRRGLGPQAARMNFGVGGTGVPTGAGPFSIYQGLRRRRRR
jgi:hypothetical protein